MAEEKYWEEEMKTHENIIFSCYTGLSDASITSASACLKVVRELGLEKVAISGLGALPLGVKPAAGKTKAARKVICGLPSCFAFAVALLKGQKRLQDCSALSKPEFGQDKEALARLLQMVRSEEVAK